MLEIVLRITGNKTEARGFLKKNGEIEQFARIGKNGADAASQVIKYAKNTHGVGIPYTIVGTPIRGRT